MDHAVLSSLPGSTVHFDEPLATVFDELRPETATEPSTSSFTYATTVSLGLQPGALPPGVWSTPTCMYTFELHLHMTDYVGEVGVTCMLMFFCSVTGAPV